MTSKEFARITAEAYSGPVSRLWSRLSKGKFQLSRGTLRYPNLVLCTETPTHFLFELFGANRTYRGLQIKRLSLNSTDAYFSQLETPTGTYGIRPRSSIVFEGLCFANAAAEGALSRRFVANHPGPKISFTFEPDSLLSPAPDCGPVYLSACYLINAVGQALRAKHVRELLVVRRDYEEKQLAESLRVYTEVDPTYKRLPKGVTYWNPGTSEIQELAAQFVSVFLTPRIRETAIGEFLRLNQLFIGRAFGSVEHLYEPTFQWIEGNPDPREQSINPDLLVWHADGKWEICDLKTAKQDRKNITKGHHRRRRFIDYAQEGIAQLCNYADYFRYAKNREWVNSRFGVTVQEPSLLLVVGSYENASQEEVQEALRTAPPNLSVIDYDTLNTLFLKSEATEPSHDRGRG